MRYETGKDFGPGGKYLDEPGTYHMHITEIDETPTDKNNCVIPDAMFRVTMKVLAGTTEGQEEKVHGELFFQPRGENDFSKKKIDRFLLATGLIGEADKGKVVEIDLQKATFRQVMIQLEKRQSRDREFLNMAQARIYHVDDGDVRDMPKNEKALRMIPPDQRRIGSQVQFGFRSPPETTQDVASLDL